MSDDDTTEVGVIEILSCDLERIDEIREAIRAGKPVVLGPGERVSYRRETRALMSRKLFERGALAGVMRGDRE